MRPDDPLYRRAVEWIALNDNSGGEDALEFKAVKSCLSVVFAADLLGTPASRIARDVIAFRKEHP